MKISTKPKAYEIVRNAILEMINNENLQPGARLPSEKELAARFNVNHQTARRGLADLVDMNIIERQVGSGTFVKSNSLSAANPTAPNPCLWHVIGKSSAISGCQTQYQADGPNRR
jgi:DNA-binding GntR family transcriptional regulator